MSRTISRPPHLRAWQIAPGVRPVARLSHRCRCRKVAPRYYNPAMALMNLDAGEHDDEPEALWAMFDVLNIACGGHAGDAASMDRVVRWCVAQGRAIGGRPRYPER